MAMDPNSAEPKRIIPPRRLDQFIGQSHIKQAILVACAAARQRGEAMDHVLLCGAAGMAKKTLAAILAQSLMFRSFPPPVRN